MLKVLQRTFTHNFSGYREAYKFPVQISSRNRVCKIFYNSSVLQNRNGGVITSQLHYCENILASSRSWFPHSNHIQNFATIVTMSDNKFIVGYAKLGTSSCKKCKTKIDKGELRIGKVVSNPFSDEGGDMKQWYHPDCMFETFKRARATTKKIEEPEDMEGFGDLEQKDKDTLNKLIDGMLMLLKVCPLINSKLYFIYFSKNFGVKVHIVPCHEIKYILAKTKYV